MTEQELRESVRYQILQNFHEKKSIFMNRIDEKNSITLNELRSMVRRELVNRLKEGEEKKVDSEVVDATDELNNLDADMKSLIKGSVKKEKGDKKTEQVSAILGLVMGLPGLLELLSKMSKLLAKGLNKVTKNKNFDEKKEGATFEHAAHSLHKKYISWLKPVAKLAFKKRIGKDEKKAEIYAQVMYAVILAVVAGHALVGAGTGLLHGFEEMGHAFHAAFEAAHGVHAGTEVTSIGNAMRAALAAVGETEAAQEFTSAMSAA